MEWGGFWWAKSCPLGTKKGSGRWVKSFFFGLKGVCKEKLSLNNKGDFLSLERPVSRKVETPQKSKEILWVTWIERFMYISQPQTAHPAEVLART